MPSRPILVLCEGQHDIAFLTRLLEVSVIAVEMNSTVTELPEPFGNFFVSRLNSRKANHAKIGGSGPVSPDEPPLLEAVYRSQDDTRHWYFLNCCGDTRSNQINALLKPVVAMALGEDPTKRLAEFGVVFVNDSDEIGITARQKLITDNHTEALARLLPDFSSVAANSIQQNNGYGAGTCIFAEPGSDKGSLENIVWALWAAAHTERRDQSHTLMRAHAVAGTKIGPDSTPSKILKATLTAAGQTECPGYSLAVILRETEALDADAMRADASCCAFVKVLTEV